MPAPKRQRKPKVTVEGASFSIASYRISITHGDETRTWEGDTAEGFVKALDQVALFQASKGSR